MKNKLLVLASLALFVGCSEKEYTKDELINNQKALEEQIKVCDSIKDKVAGISDAQKNNCALVKKIENQKSLFKSGIIGNMRTLISDISAFVVVRNKVPMLNELNNVTNVEVEAISPVSAKLKGDSSCVKINLSDNKENPKIKEITFLLDENSDNKLCLIALRQNENQMLNKPIAISSSIKVY